MNEDRAKVLVVVRSDSLRKNGGDYQVMRTFAAEIENEHGAEICYGVPSGDQIASADAVLCTNLDRPIEALHTLRICQAADVPFLLYTLHHPHDGIESYLRSGARGFKRGAAVAARFNAPMYEQILWGIRTVVTLASEKQLLPQGSVSSAQRELLRESDVIVCSSVNEAETLRSDVANFPAFQVVPHPADAPSAKSNVTYVPNRVVIAGRIEARKNQINALHIARELPFLDFEFVGGKVESESRYFEEFEALLRETPNANYTAALPKEDFYPFLQSAELVLNPSFFEVTSLIDVFCTENNIPLVTTSHTYLRANGCFRTVDPAQPSEVAQNIRSCVAQSREEGRKVFPVMDEQATTISALVSALV